MTSRSRPFGASWIPWIPLAFVFVLALAVGSMGSTGAATNADRTVEIAKTIKCPICGGETVAESNVDISRNIRVDIADRVQRGESDDDIRAFYADKYGDDQILIPTASGVTGLVWMTPVVALVVSLAALALAFRRWGEHAPVAATDADRDLVQRAQDERAHRGDADADEADADVEADADA
jgi:cytochrome c-type biogenesis protein CcmH